MTPLSLPSRQRPAVLLAVLAVAASAAMAEAQGPSVPAETAPSAVEARSLDPAARLASSVARFTAPRLLSERPRPFKAWSVSAQAFRDSILVSVARSALGTRYVRGGQSFEGGFDCSGLVRYIMTALDVSVPRTAAEQAATGIALARDTTRLRPGDLLTFGKNPRDVSHVGIYLGNGRYVHASSVAGRVIESDIDRAASPLIKVWRGARRMLTVADSTTAPATGG